MQKKTLGILLVLCLLLGVLMAMPAAAADVIEIATAGDLLKLMDPDDTTYPWDGDYKLTANIDLTGKTQSPIGTSDKVPFTGTFDGDGHAITGIKITGTDYVGLFGYANNATIENLTVSGSVSGANNVGGIVGRARNATQIIGCTNNCTVTVTTQYAGGIAGYSYGASASATVITDCVNNGDVTFTGSDTTKGQDFGGITGIMRHAMVSNCTNTGTVVGGAKNVGGIAGRTYGSATFMNCHNSGDVSALSQCGGIVGGQQVGTVSYCWNSGEISCSGAGVGGISGAFAGSGAVVSNCLNTGSVTGVAAADDGVGGIVGSAPSGKSVSNCYSGASVTGTGTTENIRSIYGYSNVENIFSSCYYDPAKKVKDDDAELAYDAAKHFDLLNSESAWIITTNGPELKALHIHAWEYLNDKQHKCGCGEIANHSYANKKCTGCGVEEPAVLVTSGKVVYVKESIATSGDGTTPDTAFKTLTEAYQALAAEGGTIVICDTVTLTADNTLYKLSKSTHSYYAAPQCGGAVKVTSKYGDNDFTNSAVLKLSLYVLRSDHIFDDITIESATTAAGISALGNDLLIGENVKCNAYSGGQYPMILSGIFEVNVGGLYFDAAVDTIVWKSDHDELGWTGNKTNPIVTGHGQALTKGTDGDGVQDIVINGGTWRNVRGGNYRAAGSSAYGYLDHELNITINGGTFSPLLYDNVQSGLMQQIYSSSDGSANMTINGGTFSGGALYLIGRSSVDDSRTVEGDHSLTINGGTFNGYYLIAGVQAKGGACVEGSLPTDTSSNRSASGTCTITISGGTFGENVAIKTTATGDVADVFTGDNAALNLVVSKDIVDTYGEQMDLLAFSSVTDYNTGDEYCAANGHTYKKYFCIVCDAEQQTTEVEITALDPRDKTFTLDPASAVEDGVSIDFSDVVVVKDGDNWVASGYTLKGGDGYYVLADSSKTFVLTDVAGDIMTVTADGTAYEVYYGQSITLTAADATEGYRFDGWFDGENQLTDKQNYTIDSVTESVSITTKYTWISDDPEPDKSSSNNNAVVAIAIAVRNNRKCVVTYKSTGAEDHVSETVKKGTVLTAPETPTKDGYTFIGWFKDINGTKPFDFNTKITESVSIYAKWAKN